MPSKRCIARFVLYGFGFSGRKKIILALVLTLILMVYVLYLGLNLIIGKTQKDSFTVRLGKNQHYYKDENGMQVIVGHYIGGRSHFNLSKEMLNSNNFNPIPGAGHNGKPVVLAPRELIHGKNLYGLHGYNILVGDMIPLDRELPDMRDQECASVTYHTNSIPRASIIIVFHNEAFSTLMRTVTSVIKRTPKSLLEEIILVDDASNRAYLGDELEAAVLSMSLDQITHIWLNRLEKRAGIVPARMNGAKKAKGKILIFLDAHCEVTPGWIEPLIERANDGDAFVCPHIDLISDDTFAYIKSVDAHWGVFSRRLHFRWLPPGKHVIKERIENPVTAYSTPVMAGGLFAVSKQLFFDLGAYDEGMLIWGGENLELSWRAWQCGAKVLIAPCSRVGHLFRRFSPYEFPGGVNEILSSNLARAALVWMDEWADFVFKFNPSLAAVKNLQNVSNRLALRAKLQCNSFSWYLQTVWPQNFFPSEDNWFGRIKNGLGSCLAPNSNASPGIGGPAFGIECGGDLNLDAMLVFTEDGYIMSDEGLCLQESNKSTVWKSCVESVRVKQKWVQKGPKLKNLDGDCLAIVNKGDLGGVNVPVIVDRCKLNDLGQIWYFERVPWN